MRYRTNQGLLIEAETSPDLIRRLRESSWSEQNLSDQAFMEAVADRMYQEGIHVSTMSSDIFVAGLLMAGPGSSGPAVGTEPGRPTPGLLTSGPLTLVLVAASRHRMATAARGPARTPSQAGVAGLPASRSPSVPRCCWCSPPRQPCCWSGRCNPASPMLLRPGIRPGRR